MTTFIHGTELMRFFVCGWCDSAKSLCTLYNMIHLADFMLVIVRESPQIQVTGVTKVR